jgi:cytochrome P450
MTVAALHRPVPGPRGNLFLGSIRGYQRNPLRLFTEATRHYGPIVRFRFGTREVYFMSHPDYVKHVLQEHNRNYHKSLAYDKTRPMLGYGLLTSEDEFWRRQRRLVQPAFHRKYIGSFATTMTDATDAMLERWEPYAQTGQPFDVAKEMMRLTLTIVGKTLFSTDVSGEADRVGQALTIALEHTSKRMQALFDLGEKLPTPENRRFNEAIRTLDEVVYGMIEERRRTGAAYNDLLSLLLHAQDEDTGERMSDKQLRDEAMTIFLAGHETTANALSWTWYLLSKHPDVARTLRAEVNQVLGGRVPTLEDLPKLRYTKMVIDESLRLFPPAWGVGRTALGDDEIDGYRIPGGAIVALSAYVTHRLPEFWDNPEGFDPERWTPERNEKRPRFAYFPFGGGPRLCIGNNFALMEAQLIVATIAQRYRIDLVPGHPIVPEPMVTLRPKHGVLMTLHRQQ